MRFLLFCLIIFQTGEVLAEELTVYVPEGLILREEPSPKAKKVMVIPFGTKVEILDRSSASEIFEFEGIKAPFFSIKHRNRQGYVFSGYLSRFPASAKKFESVEEYLRLIFGPGKRKAIKPNERDSETEHFKISYGNDIFFERIVYLGGAYDQINFPDTYEFREIFLLIRYASPSFRNIKFSATTPDGLDIDRPIDNCKEGCPTESLRIKKSGNRILVDTGGQT